MKNFITGFLIIILCFFAISASTSNVIYTKPLPPKHVVTVESFREAVPYINKGYIIKSAYGDYHTNIILEKY